MFEKLQTDLSKSSFHLVSGKTCICVRIIMARQLKCYKIQKQNSKRLKIIKTDFFF